MITMDYHSSFVMFELMFMIFVFAMFTIIVLHDAKTQTK